MTESRSRILRLSADRKALVDQLLGGAAGTTAVGAIPQSDRRVDAPLSFAEQRTWLLERFQPSVPWHHIRVALRLQGDLRLGDLNESVATVVRRHAILRARYVEVDNQLRRVIDDDPPVDLTVRDLSADQGASSTQVEAVLREEAATPFDLAHGPLLRLLLVRIADADHILSVAAHQMICDGPSIRILLAELITLYERRVREAAPQLPPLPIQYADFAAWQQSQEQLAANGEHLAYWRSLFTSQVAELRLGRREAEDGGVLPRSSVLTSTVPASRLAALRQAGSEQGATLFMTLLAAFQVVLSQYSGARDFLIGSPVSNRPHRDVEALVGPFANILPLRADLSGDPALRELIGRVRTATVEAFSHSVTPYEQIAEEMRLPRLSALILLHEPLPEPLPADRGGSLQVSGLPAAQSALPYDVRLSFLEVESALVASLEFQDSLFSAEQGRAFLSNLDRVLTAMAENPGLRLSALRAPTAEEMPSIQTLAEPVQATSRKMGEGGPPRDRLERELTTFSETVLGVTGVGVRDNFFTLGGNSLSAVRLFLLIEQSLGTRLPLSVLLETQTVEGLAVVLRKGGFSRRWTCLVPIQATGSQPPFFCVHGAGGNILFLRGLATHLSRNQPLYGFQAAGLDGETAPLQSVEETARLYVKELRTLQPHGPYYLGGFCFGAYAALEMAQQLQEQGEEVALLASFNETGAWRVLGSVSESVELHRNTLSELPPAGKAQYIRERAVYRATQVGGAALGVLGRALGAKPSRSGAAAQIRVERAMHAAGMSYGPRPYEGRFVLFRSETVAESPGETFWQQTVQGHQESYVFPGGEDYLFEEPAAPLLAKQLTDCLDRARRVFDQT